MPLYHHHKQYYYVVIRRDILKKLQSFQQQYHKHKMKTFKWSRLPKSRFSLREERIYCIVYSLEIDTEIACYAAIAYLISVKS